MQLKYIVIAGNRKQAYHWAMERGLSQNEWRYASSYHELAGLSGVTFVEAGQAWLNPLYATPELELLKFRIEREGE